MLLPIIVSLRIARSVCAQEPECPPLELESRFMGGEGDAVRTSGDGVAEMAAGPSNTAQQAAGGRRAPKRRPATEPKGAVLVAAAAQESGCSHAGSRAAPRCTHAMRVEHWGRLSPAPLLT